MTDALTNLPRESQNPSGSFFAALWSLLKNRAATYYGPENTSLSAEKTQSLLESLLYTLALEAQKEGLNPETMGEPELHALMLRGQNTVRERKEACRTAWESLCASEMPLPNAYYWDTLKHIEPFFTLYDVCYEAHLVPCSIDYPLMVPVGEETKGVSFLGEYLRRLRWEEEFLLSFRRTEEIRLWESTVPDFRGALFNLCEQVFLNALGAAVLEREPVILLTQEDVFRLADRLSEDPDARILTAADRLTADFSPEKRLYFREAAAMSLPRIREATKNGSLSAVFVPPLPDGMVRDGFR